MCSLLQEHPFVFKTQTADGIKYEGYSLDVLDKISKIVSFIFGVDNINYKMQIAIKIQHAFRSTDRLY